MWYTYLQYMLHVSFLQKRIKTPTHNIWLIDWLDKVLRRIGNISAKKRRWLLVKCDQFWNFKVSLAALTSLLFIVIQYNGHLRAKGVVILDAGNQLTSHPTDIKMVCAKCGWDMSRFYGEINQRVYNDNNNGRKQTKNSIRIAHEPVINSGEVQKAEKF